MSYRGLMCSYCGFDHGPYQCPYSYHHESYPCNPNACNSYAQYDGGPSHASYDYSMGNSYTPNFNLSFQEGNFMNQFDGGVENYPHLNTYYQEGQNHPDLDWQDMNYLRTPPWFQH